MEVVSFSFRILSSSASYITQDSLDNIWIGVPNSGVLKFDGSTFTSYNLIQKAMPSNFIYHVSTDVKNNVWISTSEGS
ncbi:MAG: hypothetical protein IPN89_17795 [Saprospiraceae bacterium]|nr:hypothetical protein [Saprospiraceae bacterium]